MAAATARGASDACIFALPSPLCAKNPESVQPAHDTEPSDRDPRRRRCHQGSGTTGKGRGHEGLHGTDTPSTADGLQPASGAGAREASVRVDRQAQDKRFLRNLVCTRCRREVAPAGELRQLGSRVRSRLLRCRVRSPVRILIAGSRVGELDEVRAIRAHGVDVECAALAEEQRHGDPPPVR